MLEHIDVGGDRITYDDETPPDITGFATTLLDRVAARGHGHREVLFEPPIARRQCRRAADPGRIPAFRRGQELLHQVDAAMNDLARPAMYEAYHCIEPVKAGSASPVTYDIGAGVRIGRLARARPLARRAARRPAGGACRRAPTASS
ncbi:hypothetical protein ACTMU2_34555 [Cupriavidus basilensis]